MNLWVFTSVFSTFMYGLLIDWRMLGFQAVILVAYSLMSYKYSLRNKTSTRRKIAISSWGAPSDPSCFGTIEVNCDILDDFLDKYNKQNPKNTITYTHIFLRALGLTMRRIKGLNGKIVFGNFVPFETVDISCVVDIEGENITAVTVKDCGKQSISEIRNQVNAKVKRVKLKKCEAVKEQMRVSDLLPTALLSLVIHLSSFLAYSCDMDVHALRLKKNCFGSIVLTNVSKMNIKDTFAPLTEFSNTMMTAVICAPTLKPVVNENKEIVVRKIINFNITFDHRFADGSQASTMVTIIEEILKHPDSLLN